MTDHLPLYIQLLFCLFMGGLIGYALCALPALGKGHATDAADHGGHHLRDELKLPQVQPGAHGAGQQHQARHAQPEGVPLSFAGCLYPGQLDREFSFHLFHGEGANFVYQSGDFSNGGVVWHECSSGFSALHKAAILPLLAFVAATAKGGRA